jgi:hypothetical protein
VTIAAPFEWFGTQLLLYLAWPLVVAAIALIVYVYRTLRARRKATPAPSLGAIAAAAGLIALFVSVAIFGLGRGDVWLLTGSLWILTGVAITAWALAFPERSAP